MAGPAGLRQLDTHTAAVLAAHRAAHEAVPLEPRDETRQRALAEMDPRSDLLNAEAAVAALRTGFREDVQDLEVTGSQAVPVQRPVQLTQGPGVQREHLAPLADERLLGLLRCHDRTLAEGEPFMHTH